MMVFARRRLALYTLGAVILCLVFHPMQYLGRKHCTDVSQQTSARTRRPNHGLGYKLHSTLEITHKNASFAEGNRLNRAPAFSTICTSDWKFGRSSGEAAQTKTGVNTQVY